MSPASAPFLLIFLSKFALPLRFLFSRHVSVQGISLLRYRLDPSTFSPSRPDAHLFSMDVPPLRPGLLNLTDSNVAPTYLSPYRYAGTPTNARLANLDDDTQGVKGSQGSQGSQGARNESTDTAQGEATQAQSEGKEEAEWESFLDVEPYTGRTMNVRISMMVSVVIEAKKYNVWHKGLKDMPLVPVMSMTQRASVGHEDAESFKSLVYGSARLLDMLTYASLVVGLALVVLGAVLLVVYHGRKRGQAEGKGLEMVTVQSPMSGRV